MKYLQRRGLTCTQLWLLQSGGAIASGLHLHLRGETAVRGGMCRVAGQLEKGSYEHRYILAKGVDRAEGAGAQHNRQTIWASGSQNRLQARHLPASCDNHEQLSWRRQGSMSSPPCGPPRG
jgi:hypothetical protein